MAGMGWLGRGLLAALAIGLAFVCSNSARAAVPVRIEARSTGGAAVLAIVSQGDQAPARRHFLLDDPPRLVFDLADAALTPDQPSCLPVSTAQVRQVRVGQFGAEPSTVRVVVDLKDASAPPWMQAPGSGPGEVLIVLGQRDPVALRPPSLTQVEDAVLLRIAGAAQLPRHAAVLADPPRVYVDLTGAALESSHRQEFEEGPVREVRMAAQAPAGDQPVARVVAELREATPYTLSADGDDLVLALGEQPWALPLPPYQPAGRLKGRRIVVDPGHGGEKVGAAAVPGRPAKPPYEKDIVLDIGTRLARLLRSEGAEVTMTREDDTNITLARRAAIANELKAEAFISIHCNSSDSPNRGSGTSVYYDRQNSVEFARLVHEELVAALGTRDRGIRNANFSVIRQTLGPGILVETAFINHEGDRARLIHPNFRERAARAMLRGVIQFLSRTPQQDSAAG
jgi:N-acetylmuramoyl-L-alanine amidase